MMMTTNISDSCIIVSDLPAARIQCGPSVRRGRRGEEWEGGRGRRYLHCVWVVFVFGLYLYFGGSGGICTGKNTVLDLYLYL